MTPPAGALPGGEGPLPAAATGDRPVRVTAAVTAAAVVAVMPSFMVGASGVLLREELGFGASGLGFAVSAFFGSTALTSVFGGRVAERLGGSKALTLIASANSLVLLSIALFAHSYLQLVVMLAAAGVVNGVAQPASNLALAKSVVSHQALTFGIKQAGIPFATLVAGASVPMIALTVGWRWSFATAAGLAVLVAVLMPGHLAPPNPRPRGVKRSRQGDAALRPLLAMAVAASAGMASATALASFLVESAVAGGIAIGAAGWLQVSGSVGGMLGRIGVGWVADRWHGIALTVVSGMLLAGAAGYAMLAVGGTVLVTLGTIIAYTFGWGWTGLMMFAVVRFNQNAPAAATGIVMTGSAGGAAIGPFLFGQVVDRASFQAAWIMATVLAVASTGLVILARTWLLRDRNAREAREG